jgi:hypothetical protein
MNFDLLHNLVEKEQKSRKSYGDYEVNYQLMERNQWKEQDRIFLCVPFFQEKQEAICGVPLVLKKVWENHMGDYEVN